MLQNKVIAEANQALHDEAQKWVKRNICKLGLCSFRNYRVENALITAYVTGRMISKKQIEIELKEERKTINLEIKNDI